MQRGFLAFLPPEIMGSHVGASPAHATGRSQSMAFRCAMAAMGHLGVELDPAAVPEAERSELAEWIAFHKQWRDLLHGHQVVLGTGSDGLVWQAQGNAERKLLFCIRTDPPQDRRPQPLTLPFAALQDRWNVSLLKIAETPEHRPPRANMFAHLPSEPVPLSGSWLAEAGLPMPAMKAESVAVFLLEASNSPTKNCKAC
jgi:alpha-galactosidase